MNTKASFLLAVCALLVGAPVTAQVPPEVDPGRSVRTRADLERLLEYYQEILRSPAYSEGVKETVRADVDRVRVRLEEGDFRLGDRIVLSVEGEPDLPDTVAVEAGPMISVPVFGDVSLFGVLRSELEGHLTAELGRFIRDPVVRAEGLMRMSIQGAVSSPGFYLVPADMLLGEALMVAGGPGPSSRIDDMRVERGQEVLLEGEDVQEALRRGLTLDQLNLQAGDQLMVPAEQGSWLANLGVIVGILGSLTFVLGATR